MAVAADDSPGPSPEPSLPGRVPGGPADPRTCFVVEFDLAGLMAGLGIDCGTAEEQEAILAAEQEALAASPVPPAEVPARGVSLLPPGPALAAWLGAAPPDRCADYDLPDVAAGYRRLAAWAQAGELAAVAEIASRTALRRHRVGQDGRPVQVLPEAAGEVALALTVSQPAALEWTTLGCRLRWQLPATGAALAAGQVDLARARLIADATAPLPDAVARAVEARVLPVAGDQTTGQLRASLRRAVIAVDPDGADRRRQHAERQAKVGLYPDPDGTATLTGTGLPALRAAAAFARVTAFARAMKAAGASGGMDYLRTYVMLGLLLGTLPVNPPRSGGPPDGPPDDGLPGPDDPVPAGPSAAAGGPAGTWPDVPPGNPAGPWPDDEPPGADDDVPPPAWPPLPAALPGPPARTGPASPPAGLLDVLLPWSALTGPDGQPAELGRIGPITPLQTREVIDLATAHPATVWLLILTDDHGRAQAVERLRRAGTGPPGQPAGDAPAGQPRAGSPAAPVIGRISIAIPERAAGGRAPGARPAGGRLGPALLRAAARATDRLQARRAADVAAGGCAHTTATTAYRPAPRLRDLVTARDATCMFPPCRQPAWRTDLDHTTPWHHGGPTCACNLASGCRTHHQIKQLPGWTLRQPQPGTLIWTTPAEQTYSRQPHRYPV